MIEHYSHKIQNAIQKELFKANSSIKIAVAWFTNDLLFQPLLLKLGAGVSVELIVNKDDINCSDDSEVDFNEFVKAGGVLRWNDTNQLLHDKFCIIDDTVVIYGSYNWTNKAEYNEESIAIAKGEDSTTQFYVDKFVNFSKKYPQVEMSIEDKPVDDSSKEELSYEMELVNYALENGRFPIESLTPVLSPTFVPYSDSIYGKNLYFYDDINISLLDKYFIARIGNKYLFVDKDTFFPINDVEFTNFKSLQDTTHNKLWLETNNKWGLYNLYLKRYVIPPIFDSFSPSGIKAYEVFLKKKHWKVDSNGNMLTGFNLDF